MKIQRSHFHLITLLLLCAFLAAVLLCARQAGLLFSPVSSVTEEGIEPASEESLIQPEADPEENGSYNTEGL